MNLNWELIFQENLSVTSSAVDMELPCSEKEASPRIKAMEIKIDVVLR
jgi:hypothetical protein